MRTSNGREKGKQGEGEKGGGGGVGGGEVGREREKVR